jgi:hypothetical protein
MTTIKILDIANDNVYTHKVKYKQEDIRLKLTHCFNKKLFIIIEEYGTSYFYHFDFLKNCIIEIY